MREYKKIENILKNAPRPAVPEDLFNKLQADITLTTTQPSTIPQPNIWRIILNSRITKLAVAAAIIIAAIFGIQLVDKLTTPAWAIEQSIEAMKNYRGLYFSGKISISMKDIMKERGIQDVPEIPDCQGDFEMWAQADETLSRSYAVKIIVPEKIVISARKLHAYIQLSNGTTYDYLGDCMKIDPWPTSKLLNFIKETKKVWKELYGKDAETGKEHILVKCNDPERNKSWQLEFDSESKLLISLRQWDASDNYEGTPTIDVKKIVYYEQLPDDIFDIDLPEPNKIIDLNSHLYDPNYGMSAEGLTQEQACKKILTEFWQAANNQDLNTIRKLFPYSASWSDEVLRSNLGYDQGPPKLLEMGQIYESMVGPVVPCTVQLKNEKMVVDIIVMFREINGKSSCIIYSNKGQPRPVK